MEIWRTNKLIAERLREAAGLLEQQGANRFRVAAYRGAADTVESLDQDVGLLLRTDGFRGLTALPGIGHLIGGAIAEMIRTGHWAQLDRLRGTSNPEAVFTSVPGIGPRLAQKLLDELHIETLESLEAAAYDGRLQNLPGFGNRRLAIVRASLSEMLGRRRRGPASRHEPAIDVLLDVDREYREKAADHRLPLITPRRFNPTNEPWLPVLHATRRVWQFTALFSNTALAHSLGRTNDWVVIYFNTHSYGEGQRTVVTETRGPLKGKRIVRGCESECEEYYRTLWALEDVVA